MSFYTDWRLGSAHWASEAHIRASGLFCDDGFYLGQFGGRRLGTKSDGPVLIVAGSGSGKLTSYIGWHAINDPGNNLFIDIKGEITCISRRNQARLGKGDFVINPLLMHGQPNQNCNVLQPLDPRSISFHGDIKQVAEALIVSSGSGEAKFFESQARLIFEAFAKFDLLSRGRTSLPRIKRLIDVIQGDLDEWETLARSMISLGLEDVSATVNVIVAMQTHGDKAFGSIMAELANALGFLTDERLRESQSEEADFTLAEALCHPTRAANLYVIVPFEMLGVWAPFLRLVVRMAMIVKARSPHTPRVTFVLDEAGQLKAEFLPQIMTLGRGLGITPVVAVQDLNAFASYGSNAAQTFLASAAYQIWFGMRDLHTGTMLSRRLGDQTLHFDDQRQQEIAGHAKRQAIRSLMSDDDDNLSATLNAYHHARLQTFQSVQSRALLTPDEALALPNTHGVVIAAGLCPPILVERPPYYAVRCNAGRFDDNPYVKGARP